MQSASGKETAGPSCKLIICLASLNIVSRTDIFYTMLRMFGFNLVFRPVSSVNREGC